MSRLLGIVFVSCLTLSLCGAEAQALTTSKNKNGGSKKSGSKKASSGKSSGHLGDPKGRVTQWNLQHGIGGKKKQS